MMLLQFLNKTNALWLTCILLCAYYIHEPIPNDTEDYWTSQIALDFFNILNSIASCSEKFGFCGWAVYRAFELLPMPIKYPDAVMAERIVLDKIELLVVTPKGFKERSEAGPAIVFFHGGGFTINNLDTYAPWIVKAAEETGYLVVSPEFRRSPDHSFPVPFEDCLNSTLWLMKRASQFNVDPKKIVVVGDSAGGNLAMSVTMELIKMSETSSEIQIPVMLTLINPMLQLVDFQLPSFRENSQYFFRNHFAERFWLSYLGLDNRPELAALLSRNKHIDKVDPALAEALKMVNEDAIPEKYKLNNANQQQDSSDHAPLIDETTRAYLRDMILDPRLCPLIASDQMLTKLPFTSIYASGYDPLRDEAIILHERMKSLGARVRFEYLPRSMHVSLMLGVAFGSMSPYHAAQSTDILGSIRKHADQ